MLSYVWQSLWPSSFSSGAEPSNSTRGETATSVPITTESVVPAARGGGGPLVLRERGTMTVVHTGKRSGIFAGGRHEWVVWRVEVGVVGSRPRWSPAWSGLADLSHSCLCVPAVVTSRGDANERCSCGGAVQSHETDALGSMAGPRFHPPTGRSEEGDGGHAHVDELVPWETACTQSAHLSSLSSGQRPRCSHTSSC